MDRWSPGGLIGPLTEWAWGKLKPAAQDRYGGVPGQPWNPMPQLRALGDIFSVAPNVARALPRAEDPGSFGVDFLSNFDPDLTYMDLQRDRFDQPEPSEDLTRRSPFSVHLDMLRGEVDPADVRQTWERSLSQSMGLGLDLTQPGAEIIAPLTGALASWGTFMRMASRNFAGAADDLARNGSRWRNVAEGFGSIGIENPGGDIIHTLGRNIEDSRLLRTTGADGLRTGGHDLVIRGQGEDVMTISQDFTSLADFRLETGMAIDPNTSLFVSADQGMMTDLGALAELADRQGVTLYASPGGPFRPMQGRGTIPENMAPGFDQLGFEMAGTYGPGQDALYVRRPYPVDEIERVEEMGRRGVGQGRLSEASDEVMGLIPEHPTRHIGGGDGLSGGTPGQARQDIHELAGYAVEEYIQTRDPSMRRLADALERIGSAPLEGNPNFDALTHIQEILGTVEGNTFLVRHGFADAIAPYSFGRRPPRSNQPPSYGPADEIDDLVDWVETAARSAHDESGPMWELYSRVRTMAEDGELSPGAYTRALREVLGETDASRLLNEMGYASPWGDVSGMSPDWQRQPFRAPPLGELMLENTYGGGLAPALSTPGPGGTAIMPNGVAVHPDDRYAIARNSYPPQYDEAIRAMFGTAVRHLDDGDGQMFLRVVDNFVTPIDARPVNERDLGYLITDLMEAGGSPATLEVARDLLRQRYHVSDGPGARINFGDIYAGVQGSGRRWSHDFFNAGEHADYARLSQELDLGEHTVRELVEGVRREMRAGREPEVTQLLDRAVPELENARRLVGAENLDALFHTLRRAGRENARALLAEGTSPTLGGGQLNQGLPDSVIDDILDFIYLTR